ncbi:hypothetical protein [Nocardia fluminea]|uniref:hypothetical protein n=1 Tax=Nocardia fluminea TaxID=134984 RepID=UPI0033DE834A
MTLTEAVHDQLIHGADLRVTGTDILTEVRGRVENQRAIAGSARRCGEMVRADRIGRPAIHTGEGGDGEAVHNLGVHDTVVIDAVVDTVEIVVEPVVRGLGGAGVHAEQQARDLHCPMISDCQIQALGAGELGEVAQQLVLGKMVSCQ